MSQLVKLLKNAGRATGRPTAGFGARSQEAPRRRLVLIAALDGPDIDAARAAIEAGADVVEIPVRADAGDKDLVAVGELIAELPVPVGVAVPGSVPAGFDARALEGKGLDYLKVEAGDVPATVFLAEGLAVVLEVKESFSDVMLKMLNFLPAKAIQVDSPDTVEGFTVKRLMEERVSRELIGKPLLMRIGASIKPAAAQLLTLVAPNALVVPAAEVGPWKRAIADLKDFEEEESETGPISLKAPVSAT
ncbi:MAG: hypothetical protein KGJ86_14895 [Chloroflexota bacterium]|nr:hypothetical protein [Chloroflexota bacterium]